MVRRAGANAAATLREIRDLTGFLVEKGWADDFNFPSEQPGRGGSHSISYANGLAGASYLSDQAYADTYDQQLKERAYNFRLLDGALVQMAYEFTGSDVLLRHRLAFLPSPDLSEFQNAPEIYLEEVLYAEVVERKVVTVPMRFDFDNRDGVPVEVDHPVSHLTLGQYSNCRLPVTSGVSPHAFMAFILRNFYNTALRAAMEDFPSSILRLPLTISMTEKGLVHVGIPGE